MFFEGERLAIFIDGTNLYAASKGLGFEIDFKKLREEFAAKGNLVRAHYYTTYIENDDYSPVRPLVDWLNYNGYATVSKIAREFTDTAGRKRIKGSTEIDIAVDALEIASSVQHIVLFTGDRDFKPLVCSLQRKGVRVTIVSTIRGNSGMAADELRRQADNFVELDELKDRIGRPPRIDNPISCRDHHRPPA